MEPVSPPEGVDDFVQAIAHLDGTVILHLLCAGSPTRVRLDVFQAAHLALGIWEAVKTAAQQLTEHLGEARPAPPGDRSPILWRRLSPVDQDAAMAARRTIGLHIRRIRTVRNKSLRVISGLAGMSCSTLRRIEHGQRDLTLSEIVALAHALQVDPEKLIRLPIPAPARR